MGISDPIGKVDHGQKTAGSALYVADYPARGVLTGRLLRSTRARARLVEISIPDLPEGYLVVDSKDVPGTNGVHIVLDDTPVFAHEYVHYVGDPILMVVGPEPVLVEQILGSIVVTYEDLEPVVDLEKSETAFFDYTIEKGDVSRAFQEADRIIEERIRTGYQAHAYLEPQGMVGLSHGGRITVHGSLQCPYYVHKAVVQAMGFEPDRVRVIQDVTGGGFGGKEDFPSILACQVAVAAHKAEKPVQVIFNRREDMEFTPKRHPSLCTYRVAVKDGRITAMDIDVRYNAGAYTTLSAVVLQRGIIGASGVYTVPSLHIRGRAMKTNTVPTGAFRGFGGPQTFFAIELVMEHVAGQLGRDPLGFKLAHLAKQGDETSTSGRHHFPVPIRQMVEEIDALSGYREKRKAYRHQSGRFRRGVGLSLAYHGAGFTGSGERDLIKAVARLHKRSDGVVEILTSITDIGQGSKTTFTKIVSRELGLPTSRIIVENPDTDRVPDSGPTVASRSLMVVGELLRRAASRLKGNWREGEEQMIEERFKEPDFVIPFSLETFKGDAYPAYSWSVNVIEVEVDTLTGVSRVLGAYGSYDVGTPIDEHIVTGQMEGGLLQGIGFGSMEDMTADAGGRIRNNSFSDYTIPTSVDVPNLQVRLHIEKYPSGPFGAKGAGELPLAGSAPAYVLAMEHALGTPLDHAPFTMQDAMGILSKETI